MDSSHQDTATPSSRDPQDSPTSPDSADTDSSSLFQSKTQRTYSSDTNQASSTHKTSSGWFKESPTVNVNTTCGRHTDQLLFGGPGLKDLFHNVFGKSKEE